MKQSFLFLSIILSASSLSAREPAWVFNNGPDAKLISLGQGQLHHEGGLTKVTPTGSDLSLIVTMGEDDAFPADERPSFAVRYKYDTTLTQAGLFFTTDALTALSDRSYSAFPVVGDKTWRNAIVDMRQFDHKNWTGTITSFRFDPTNPSDTNSSYQVSRLGFFPSAEEAKSFLDAAVDSPDYSVPTTFIAPLERVLVPGGSLFEGFDRADFMLQSMIIDHPSETTIVQFRPKGGTRDDSVIPVCQTNRRGFTHMIAKLPGEYRLVNTDVRLDDISSLPTKTQAAIRFVVARRLLDTAEDRRFEGIARELALRFDVASALKHLRLELLVGGFEFGFELFAARADVGRALIGRAGHILAQLVDFELLPGLIDLGDHVLGEVQDALKVARGDIEQEAELARRALDEPDVAHRAGEFDVAHALAAHLFARDFDAALVTGDALIADALVFAAVALEVLRGTEDLLAEEAVLLGLERAVVDRLRLGHLAIGPGTDLFRAGEGDAHLVEVVNFEH